MDLNKGRATTVAEPAHPTAAMNFCFRFVYLALCGVCCAPFASATTATTLSSFEALEEPLVRFNAASHTFAPDSFVNITDLGDGAFRMRLRYEANEWDGDRDTQNRDRERAEVKGLGPHQKEGETFEYTTTWRASPSLQGPPRFCHIFQLKSTNGDSGAPLITISIAEGTGRAGVHYWSGQAKTATAAREFSWVPGRWQTVRIRVKTTKANDGEVLVSVDGDDFRGVTGVALFRTGADDYRPKWGLYRGVAAGLPIGDDYIDHRAISARKIGAPDETTSDTLAATSLAKTENDAKRALEWLLRQDASPARTLALATVAAHWAERDPAAAMEAVEKWPLAEDRRAAALRVLSRWSDQNPEKTLQWLSARAPNPELDDALWYFTTDTTHRYVRRPIALAALPLISDAELRFQAVDHVVMIWGRKETAETARYVEQKAPLSAEQKAVLLQKLRRRE